MSSTTVDKGPVNITETALEQLSLIKESQNIPDGYALRIGVKGGGCSGFQYILGFDEKKDGDEMYEIGGMSVLIQQYHSLYLIGMEIDWLEGLENRGFIFNNPNADEVCGCGSSFSA